MSAGNPTYAAIATYLRGRFRTLDGPDDHPYAQINTLPSGPSREEFLAASPLPETVSAFLLHLDAKIDAILASLQSSSLEHDFPHTMEVLSISASNLTFTTSMPLAPGDWLEVVINFRQTGILTASGIGVIRERRVEKDAPVFTFAFTRIAEDEREKIIRYVFKEERRLLRETRLE